MVVFLLFSNFQRQGLLPLQSGYQEPKAEVVSGNAIKIVENSYVTGKLSTKNRARWETGCVDTTNFVAPLSSFLHAFDLCGHGVRILP